MNTNIKDTILFITTQKNPEVLRYSPNKHAHDSYAENYKMLIKENKNK